MKTAFPSSITLLGGAFLAGCNAPGSTQTAMLGASSQTAFSPIRRVAAATPTPTPTPTPLPIARSLGVPGGHVTASGLTVPRGFDVQLLAEGLYVPRRMAIAPGGTRGKYDVFVSESKANRVSVLRVSNGKLERKSTFSDALNQPYGLAFLGDSLYVGNTDAVVKLPYSAGALTTSGAPQKVAALTEGGYNQHWTRNLLAAPDGKLFVTVGSSCNSCEEGDAQRAAISEMDPDGSDKHVFASGLRNPVGVALRPGTSELWTVVNERDNLGDDTPPDYLTRVQSGAFYGWPYAYTNLDRSVTPDPNFGSNSAMVSKTVAPDVPVQAHSAALGVAFYPQRGGSFPSTYRGDAFLSFHGSWNRSAKTGYKIVRVHFEGGQPRSVSDFLTGYLAPDGGVWGRPVDVQVAPDGSLLVSDDGGGRIWRVVFNGKSTPESRSAGAA